MTMRPNLIPHSFITKNMRKQYHKRQSQRTWFDFAQEYHSMLLLGFGVLMIALILYIKYTDKLKVPKEPSKGVYLSI